MTSVKLINHSSSTADWNKYDNLYHYILESAKQAIDAAFTYGFTCNGKRIKKKEFITNSTTD